MYFYYGLCLSHLALHLCPHVLGISYSVYTSIFQCACGSYECLRVYFTFVSHLEKKKASKIFAPNRQNRKQEKKIREV